MKVRHFIFLFILVEFYGHLTKTSFQKFPQKETKNNIISDIGILIDSTINSKIHYSRIDTSWINNVIENKFKSFSVETLTLLDTIDNKDGTFQLTYFDENGVQWVSPCIQACYYAESNLSLTKNVDDQVLIANSDSTATYTLKVCNEGVSASPNTEVVENFLVSSSDVMLLSHSATQGTFDPNTGIWTIGTLPTGFCATLTINIEVNSLGEYMNIASVSGSNPDPDPTNNVDSVVLIYTNASIPETVTTAKPDIEYNPIKGGAAYNGHEITTNMVKDSGIVPCGVVSTGYISNENGFSQVIQGTTCTDLSGWNTISLTGGNNVIPFFAGVLDPTGALPIIFDKRAWAYSHSVGSNIENNPHAQHNGENAEEMFIYFSTGGYRDAICPIESVDNVPDTLNRFLFQAWDNALVCVDNTCDDGVINITNTILWDDFTPYGRVGSFIEGSNTAFGGIIIPNSCNGTTGAHPIGIPIMNDSDIVLTEFTTYGSSINSGINIPHQKSLGSMPNNISSIYNSGLVQADLAIVTNGKALGDNCKIANFNYRVGAWYMPYNATYNTLPEFARYYTPSQNEYAILQFGKMSYLNF